MLNAPLDQFRILHFATHAILPTDIACLDEPAIVTSPAAKATDASSALLTASQIAGKHMDAEVAILSACNTGGPGGTTAGESLSGLARSFFVAGTRALLVTHWSASDHVTAQIVYHTMESYQRDQAGGLSAALAETQRSLLAAATGDKAGFAHPAYWAVMALIGAGTTAGPSRVAALSGVSASGL